MLKKVKYYGIHTVFTFLFYITLFLKPESGGWGQFGERLNREEAIRRGLEEQQEKKNVKITVETLDSSWSYEAGGTWCSLSLAFA